MLEIKDLKVNSLEGNSILKGLDLSLKDHEIHVLMGPNGAGKSTICKAIMHHPSYQVINGNILFQDQDITHSNTSDIAKLGIYYISQSPIEIEGITNAEMLRTSLLDRGQQIDIFTFNKKCNEICKKLDLPKSFLHRNVNEGMSGGERKKNELFGMWLLTPSLVILDEIDSGLDVDALKVVAENILEYQKQYDATILVVTHQQVLIDSLQPQFIHIMNNGKIVKTGDVLLAKEIEKNGFSKYCGTNCVSEEA